MTPAAEHHRLTESALENFDRQKAAKEYFEYSDDDSIGIDMIIFMRDKCPALYDKFMSEWGAANEQMLVDWTVAQVPDGPEGE